MSLYEVPTGGAPKRLGGSIIKETSKFEAGVLVYILFNEIMHLVAWLTLNVSPSDGFYRHWLMYAIFGIGGALLLAAGALLWRSWIFPLLLAIFGLLAMIAMLSSWLEFIEPYWYLIPGFHPLYWVVYLTDKLFSGVIDSASIFGTFWAGNFPEKSSDEIKSVISSWIAWMYIPFIGLMLYFAKRRYLKR